MANMQAKKDIFARLLRSERTNCVVKIKLKGVTNPVITAVDRIEKHKITLQPTCLYGYKIGKRTITLPDIERVTSYKTKFDNPLFKKLRDLRNNIPAMRQTFATQGSGVLLKPGLGNADLISYRELS